MPDLPIPTDPATGLPRLYTLPELAAAAHIKTGTLRKKVSVGALPAIRVGKQFLVADEVARAYLSGAYTPQLVRRHKKTQSDQG